MRSVCPHDCPSCCSLDVRVDNGRITTVTGDRQHAFTQGVICGKVRAYGERVHSPLRIVRRCAEWSQGTGVRSRSAGGTRWGDRPPVARRRSPPTGPRRSCVLLYGLHGALQYHGPRALPRPGRQPARSHDLRVHRLRRVAGHARRGHRQRLRADGGRRPGGAVGDQRGLLHDQRHDAGQAGAGPGRVLRRHRSVPHGHRPAGRRAPDGEARQRWRAGPGDDARPGARGSARPRLPRDRRWHGRSDRPRLHAVSALRGRAGALRDARHPHDGHHPLRPSLRAGDPPRVPAHRHRNLAPRQRRR